MHRVVVRPGVAFWPTPTEEAPITHPWVVLAVCDGVSALLVNITDEAHYPRSTCRLAVGDHKVVKKPSVAYYSKCIELPVKALRDRLTSGNGINVLDAFDAGVVERMRRGARDSGDLRASLKRKYSLL
jgi:hypothetical protein